VIACSQYDKVLNANGDRKFDDMDEAEEEGNFIAEKLKELNYEVQLHLNPS